VPAYLEKSEEEEETTDSSNSNNDWALSNSVFQ
jgi:hypothetical protein